LTRKVTKHTWSNNQPWEGFEPWAYHLDQQKVCDLPMKEILKDEAGKEITSETNIGQILFVTLHNEELVEVDIGIFDIKVTCANGRTHRYDGSSFSRNFLAALLTLRENKVNGFESSWFWYDKDSQTHEPGDVYFFFVVHNGLIVEERAAFFDDFKSGFDPSIFEIARDKEPVWRANPYWKEAEIAYWYRKFYQETRTGQLMVLRPDEPTLYYFPERRYTIARRIDNAVVMLSEIRVTLRLVLAALICLLIYLFLKRF
jgi:hypothetical protein